MVVLQRFEPHQRASPENDYSGQSLIHASIVSIALTSVVMALRFYAKTISSGRWGYDDGLIFGAYILNVGLCSVAMIMVRFAAVGHHEYEVPPDQNVIWAKCLFAFEMLYFVAVTLPRMSILCLYLRVFGWKGAMRRITQAILGLVIALGLSMCFVSIFQCRPFMNWWHQEVNRQNCIDEKKFFHGQCIPGFLLDLAIMALPLRTIWRLKLPTAKRLALLLVFTVASLGVVASVVRAGSFFKHDDGLRDSTWAVLTRWSIIEVGCYIVANGLAHLRPLFSRFAPPRVKDALTRVVDSASGRRSNTPGGWTSATPEKQTPEPRDSNVPRMDKEYPLVSGSGQADVKEAPLAPPPSAKLPAPPPYRGSWEPDFARKILADRKGSPESQDRASVHVTTEVSVHAQ
ncbi:hypothetical protein B0T16DRAFT_492184 [Cercophora newfieldiana]|uniref:Rhodopsin domain-containing protein n=1 Tax=Cercophora newfieldiana TaxID=92897 RepID=A0AA39YBH4_9PEZI|nr:hypothetical protein B0T16DRAFT_492184 [Cercophora newfieldiana]